MGETGQVQDAGARVPGVLGYGLALAATAAAGLVRHALDPLLQGVQPYAFFYLSVAFTAMFAGMGPALVATALGTYIGTAWFLRPLEPWSAASLVPMTIYASVCACMIGLVHHARRSAAEASANARRSAAAEAEARQKIALLQGLTESVLDGILIVSPDGRRLFANEEFDRIFHFPPEVLASRSDEGLIRWAETRVSDSGAFREAILSAYRGEVPVRAELRLKDGRVFDRFGAPVLHDGVRHGWVWTFRDITARMETERRLRESEEHLRRVLDNLYAFVGVLTPDGTLVEVNRAPLEAAGIAADDVLGTKFWDAWWWSYAEDVQVRIRDAVERAKRGEVVRFDVPARMRDGLMWIDFQVAPVRDREGRVTHVVPSAMDVTARRAAELAWRESEQRVRLLLDSTAEAIYGLDTDGTCTFVNQACVRLLGYEADELVGGDMHARIHHTRADGTPFPASVCPIGRAARTGEHLHLPDEVLWRKDGTSFAAEFFAHPVVRDGQLAGAVVSFLDISERKRVARSLAESQASFQQAFADAPIGMALTAFDGRLLHVNRAYCALTGYSEAELREASFHQLTHPDDLAENVGALDKLLAGEIPAFFMEKRYIRKDGRVLWVRASASLRRDPEGGSAHVVGIIEDIDERRRAEEALRRATTLLAAISDATGDVIFAKDRDGRLTFANPGTLALVGKPAEEVLGRTDAEVLQDEAAALGVMANDARIMAAARAEDLEEVVPLPDGTRRVWHSRKTPYVDGEGRVIGLLGVSRDITERKAAAEALAAAKDELAAHAAGLERIVAERTSELTETIRELEAFSYSLSHDMRAPLRAMKGFAQILEGEYSERLGPEGALYLGKISRAAGRLDQLIQDVLTYSRIVQEKIQLQPVDVERLVHQLIEENPAFQPPNAHVEVEAPLHPVLGHEAYLMQILSNLVDNAVKFVPAGAAARVRVRTEAAGAAVRLVVEDDGIGIAPEDQERIFGMFQRLHGPKAYEGTGIGLTIVRKAVERMGGRLGIVSEPGRGSAFWIELRSP